MTKAEAEAKLALLPLVTGVTVDEGTGADGETPTIDFFYVLEHLRDLSRNLPLLQEDQLASLAILLLPAAQVLPL